ncbi:MAG: SoxR reducing system RseC family protein [Desulfobacterales bacterium]|nr:MAG: SoxR reducing system RseC family protein [Desulfobacterales bacterium]UCD90107.1 MAG: SoxR reducing system RseC family protein [Desulfobacterales bacterium]
MAQRRGLVVRVEKDGWAQVATERKGACDGCGPGHNCQSCLSTSKIVTQVLNKAGAKAGDLVTVSLDSEMILKNAAVLYLLPVVGLVASALLGADLSADWGVSETQAAIGFGVAGLCLGFFIAVFISKRMSANNRLTPIISRIIQPGAKYSPLSHNVQPDNKKNMCAGCH